MKFRTEIERHPSGCTPRLSYDDSILMVGSCFSDNIGKKFDERFFDVMINPAGVLFNPVSIANTLEMNATGSYPVSPEGLVFSRSTGLWCSPDHHGQFSSVNPDTVLSRIASSARQAADFMSRATRVFVTLGSNHVYVSRATGRVVANCHRLPADSFIHKQLSLDECVVALCRCVDTVKSFCAPSCHVFFTVSPVRHTAYTLSGNSLSKATLRLAIEEVISRYPDTACYFPAFEIMVDDLRDYRFYDDDLKHPSAVAADYIYDYLSSQYMNQQTLDISARLYSLSKRLNHRPLTDNQTHIQEFQHNTRELADRLAASLPPRVAARIFEMIQQ